MSDTGSSEYYSHSSGPSTAAQWSGGQQGPGAGWHPYSPQWQGSSGGNGFRGNRWRGRGPRGYFQGGRGRAGPPPHPHFNYNQQNQYHPNAMWNPPGVNSNIPPPQLSMPPPHPHGHGHGHAHHQQYPKNSGQQKSDHQKHHKQNANNSKNSNCNLNQDSKENESTLECPPKGSKRRPMSQNYPTRRWNREDAELALKAELETTRTLRNQNLIIRFPDPELSREIVQKYHPSIVNVHFQVPSGPRYCFVQLAPNCNSEKIIKFLESIEFGTGKLTVEKKSIKDQDNLSPESIDPYTLFIGNLPTNLNIATVKEKFPTASRVDVGFAQKMRYTRYAFLRYETVEEAISAYKKAHNLILDSRSIVVRFRRLMGLLDTPTERKTSSPVKSEQHPAKKRKEAEEEVKPVPKKEDDDDEEEDDDDEDDDDDDDDDDEDNGDDDEEERTRKMEDDDDDDDEEDVRRVERPPDDDDDENEEAEDGFEWDAEPQPAVENNERNIDNLFRDLDARLENIEDTPLNAK